MENFRPISLFTTFYKAIAKVLANRLKKVLPMIIHQSQTTFIKGRNIYNNIALAQEICEDFNQGRLVNSFCAKIDLKKHLAL